MPENAKKHPSTEFLEKILFNMNFDNIAIGIIVLPLNI